MKLEMTGTHVEILIRSTKKLSFRAAIPPVSASM
jgi:hypothetical protein